MPHTRSPYVTGLRCLLCGRRFAPHEAGYVCPDHGDHGVLEVEYDYAAIGRDWSPANLPGTEPASLPDDMHPGNGLGQWRYRPLLPIAPDSPLPPLCVGGTPLYDAPRLGAAVGIENLWLKDESHQPTGSLKDRASALAVVKAREAGAEVITTASTGNAAAALAGLCASVGTECVIFVPKSAPPAKVAQLLAYGARVFLVDGTYDQAFELCLRAAEAFGWYNRNTGYNPYMVEGKKTAAFEICEQLGWRVPDQVYVGVGDGCIISGLYKGFYDLHRLGWIDRMPRLMGVQSAQSDFLCQAFEQDADPAYFPPVTATTVADSIAAGLPRDRVKAMRAVRETGGAFVRVPDQAILAAIPELAARTGVFAEPAAAAALAGLKQAKAQGLVGPEHEVVLLVTGNGLKDVASATTACNQAGVAARVIAPDMDGLRRALEQDA